MSDRVAVFSPGEVLFFGEHAVVYGRTGVSAAISAGIRCAALHRSDGVVRLTSHLGTAEHYPDGRSRVSSPALAPVLSYAVALASELGCHGGADLEYVSGIPEQSGLASSAAVSSATLGAIAALCGRVLPEAEAVERVYRGEIAIQKRGSVIGSATTVLGGLIRVKNGVWQALGAPADAPIAVIDTLERCETSITTGIVRERLDRDRTATERCFDEIDAMACEGLEAILRADWPSVGRLMDANQERLESLGVSTERIRLLRERIAGHVHGSKITGAGGGGCVVALPRPGETEALEQAVRACGMRLVQARLDGRGARLLGEELPCAR